MSDNLDVRCPTFNMSDPSLVKDKITRYSSGFWVFLDALSRLLLARGSLANPEETGADNTPQLINDARRPLHLDVNSVVIASKSKMRAGIARRNVAEI